MNNTNGKKKEMKVIAVIEESGRRPYWVTIGRARVNKDDSINVYLDALPIATRKLQLRALDGNDEGRAHATDETSVEGGAL